MSAQTFVIPLLNGIVYGLLLFMLASGLTLIFSMMNIVNFAHASFYMLGAYVAYQLSTAIGFWAALLITPIVIASIGAIVERWGIRPVQKHGRIAEMLLTFSLGVIIPEVVQVIWGRVAVPYRIPAELAGSIQVLGVTYQIYRFFMMGLSILIFVSLYVVLKRTRIGLIVQASLTHSDMVGYLGHNVPRIFTGVFACGCGLAGLAGAVGGNAFTTEPGIAQSFGIVAFAVIVLGGMGSIGGALAASLLIGLIQNFAIALDYSIGGLIDQFMIRPIVGDWGASLEEIKINQMAPLLPYFLLVVVMAIRPQGLFGRRR